MAQKVHDYQDDIDDIQQIPIITNLLDVICQTTGMGFTAVARVTEDRWITCSVRDDIGFGLKPGNELEIKTTICNEIRQNEMAVTIDHVEMDPLFYDHHTPLQYSFQSYISVPIILKDGSFFGTLCAIDPEPHQVSTPAVTGMFALFADLISFHLSVLVSMKKNKADLLAEKAFNDKLEKEVEKRTEELINKNKELESFAYISSHDLQEPLRKIQTISSIIASQESQNLSAKGKDYFKRMQDAAKRMQTLINDLLAYSRTNVVSGKLTNTDLNVLLNEVLEDLNENVLQTNAVIKTTEMCHADVIPFQLRQLMYNLIGNSLKFTVKGRQPQITIASTIASGSILKHEPLDKDILYCHISIADNGIGFEPRFSDRIFEVFQRLHERAEYTGTGIGLAIVKKIVDNHNGYITASGEINKGARFDIYIPVH